jgi:uncharacterized protein (TIGR02996 family)
MMAIISKAVFEKTARLPDGRRAGAGDVLSLDRYLSKNKNLEALEAGGDLFLFTVRPKEKLWLVARLVSPVFETDHWEAEANSLPITDISHLRGEIKFATGKGITAKPGALGMSLQTPRALAADDVVLLAKAAGAAPESEPTPNKKPKKKKAATKKQVTTTTKTTAVDKPTPAVSKAPASAPRPKPKRPEAPPKAARPSTTQLLDDAREAVASGDFALALGALLALWRRHRHPRLGTLIDVVAAKLRASQPLTRDDHARWLELCARDDPADLDGLLPVLGQHNRSAPFRECLRALARRRPDPRVAFALCKLLDVTGLKSFELKDLWAEALTVITYHADARGTEALEEVARGLATDKRAWVTEYMADFVTTTLKTLPTITGDGQGGEVLPEGELVSLNALARGQGAAREGEQAVVSSLSRAAAAVQSGDHGAALEALLDARATHPTEAIARAVAGCSRALRQTQKPLADKPARKALETWLALAGEGPASEVARLLEQLDSGHIASVKQRLDRLVAFSPDPRIAEKLLEVCAREEADLIRPQWMVIYGLLVIHAGAESLSRLRELSTGFPALGMVARKIETTYAGIAVPEAARPHLEAVLQSVGSAPDEDLGEALLRQVLEHPESDEHRLVYADWLLERGDPRGEFIQLQYQRLEGKGDTRSGQREAKLQKQHWKEWIGALSQVVVRSSLRFERGFLVACEVKPKHKATMKGVTGDPMWATVEDVELDWERPQDGFQHPVLRSLRRLRWVRYPLLKALCESETPVQVEELQLLAFFEDAEHIEDIFALLAATRSLPRVRKLALGMYWAADAASEKLLASPLAQQLQSLSVDVDANASENPYAEVGPWQRQAKQHAPTLPELDLDVSERGENGAHWRATFTQSEGGGLTRLELDCYEPRAYRSAALRGSGTYPTLSRILGSIAPGDLTHLTLKSDEAAEPRFGVRRLLRAEDDEAAQTEQALARFPGLEVDRSGWPEWW